MKGAQAAPRDLQQAHHSQFKVQTRAQEMNAHCPASAPSPSSCYKGHDDLKSEVFQAISSRLHWFYFCNAHLDCFSGPSSILCHTALPIQGVKFSNQCIYIRGPTDLCFPIIAGQNHCWKPLQRIPRRQLMPRVCCSAEQQQVQAGLCQEIPSAGGSMGRHFVWAAKISHVE